MPQEGSSRYKGTPLLNQHKAVEAIGKGCRKAEAPRPSGTLCLQTWGLLLLLRLRSAAQADCKFPFLSLSAEKSGHQVVANGKYCRVGSNHWVPRQSILEMLLRQRRRQYGTGPPTMPCISEHRIRAAYLVSHRPNGGSSLHLQVQ